MQKLRLFVLSAAVALCVTGPVSMAPAADSGPSVVSAPDLKPARDKIAANDHAGAIPLLQAVLKDHPDDADANNLLGFSLRKTGKWQDAVTYYNKALAIDPKHAGANEYLGELYAERGEIDKAKERLAVLQASCKDCPETKDLTAAIEKAAKK